MTEAQDSHSIEELKTLVARAGLFLNDEMLATIKQGYDIVRAEADALREQDLTGVEPAHVFIPDRTK